MYRFLSNHISILLIFTENNCFLEACGLGALFLGPSTWAQADAALGPGGCIECKQLKAESTQIKCK